MTSSSSAGVVMARLPDAPVSRRTASSSGATTVTVMGSCDPMLSEVNDTTSSPSLTEVSISGRRLAWALTDTDRPAPVRASSRNPSPIRIRRNSPVARDSEVQGAVTALVHGQAGVAGASRDRS